MATHPVREYLGVNIWPKNAHGMFHAVVYVAEGGIPLAADTRAGIKRLIRETLAANNWPSQS